MRNMLLAILFITFITMPIYAQIPSSMDTKDMHGYQGLTSYVDSLPATGVPNGSIFVDIQSGNQYVYKKPSWYLFSGVASSDTMQLTNVGITPAWCSIGFKKVKFIMKTTGADSTKFQIYGKKNPGGLVALGDIVSTSGDAEVIRDYGYPGLFDSLYIAVTEIQGSLIAARLQIVGIK